MFTMIFSFQLTQRLTSIKDIYSTLVNVQQYNTLQYDTRFSKNLKPEASNAL